MAMTINTNVMSLNAQRNQDHRLPIERKAEA